MPSHRETPTRRVNPSGKTVWVARCTNPQGQRRSFGTFKKKGPCDQVGRSDCCAQHRIDAKYAEWERPAGAGTVGDYVTRWLEEHEVSERTMRTNRGRIRAVLDVELEGRPLRAWPLRDLERRHRRALVDHMLVEQRRAPEGARDILRVLSAMTETAIDDGLATANPWLNARVRDDDRRAQKKSRKPRVFTFDQMHAFAAKASYRPRYRPRPDKPPPKARPAPEYEPMIRLLADCGVRIGELLALVRELQSFGTGIGHVKGTAWEGQIVASSAEKAHDREFPIPPGCLTLLRAMPPRIDTPWLFPSPAGKLWRYGNWHRQIWEPTCEATGMEATPHDFRHSWNTHLRAAGIDPADLADVAGHSVETATRVYTHPTRASFDQIRSVIG